MPQATFSLIKESQGYNHVRERQIQFGEQEEEGKSHDKLLSRALLNSEFLQRDPYSRGEVQSRWPGVCFQMLCLERMSMVLQPGQTSAVAVLPAGRSLFIWKVGRIQFLDVAGLRSSLVCCLISSGLFPAPRGTCILGLGISFLHLRSQQQWGVPLTI